MYFYLQHLVMFLQAQEGPNPPKARLRGHKMMPNVTDVEKKHCKTHHSFIASMSLFAPVQHLVWQGLNEHC